MSIINLDAANEKLLRKRLEKISRFLSDLGIPMEHAVIVPTTSGVTVRIDVQLRAKPDLENLLQIMWALNPAEARRLNGKSAALRHSPSRKTNSAARRTLARRA